MRRIMWFFILFSFLPSTGVAQEVPKVEIFGGYSRFRMPSGIDLARVINNAGVFTADKASLNGWDVTVTGNLTRWLGAEADFGGYRGTIITESIRGPRPPGVVNDTQRIRIHSYLFGPRVTYRGDKRITPFAHALVGRVGMTLVQSPQSSGGSLYTFGLALGGGLDINVARHVAIRAIQADYVRSRFGFKVENNLRLSFGEVVRF
jgi:opacity protein-like surface antigen